MTTMKKPVTSPGVLEPVPGILDIEPYVGGRAAAPGAQRVFKLSSNESPLGPSPKALEAYRAAAGQLAIYPEGSSRLLREAIARVHGLDAERIICGNGSDELLHLITQVYCRPGDEVLYSEHAFLVYRIAALAASAVPVVAPEPRRIVDIDAMIARMGPRTRIVFLANPNNPTGSYLKKGEVKRLLDALPGHALLVIDAAYAEYVDEGDYESGLGLASANPQVIFTRTFSKIYALAGLRTGWLYAAPEIVGHLNRARGPFNVSVPAQAAAAAAVEDRAHVAQSKAHNDKWLSWLTHEIRALGFQVDDSVCNFLLIHFGHEAGKTADDADRFLMARGLILRGVRNYGLPDALRLTVGTEEANRLVVAALADFVKARP